LLTTSDVETIIINQNNIVRSIITSITFSSTTVTSIDASAFSSCTSLVSITIPDTVTSIATNAFTGCTNVIAFYNGPVIISSITNLLYPNAYLMELNNVDINIIKNLYSAISPVNNTQFLYSCNTSQMTNVDVADYDTTNDLSGNMILQSTTINKKIYNSSDHDILIHNHRK